MVGYTSGFSEILNLSSTSDYNKIAISYTTQQMTVFVNGFNFVTNTMNALSGLSQIAISKISCYN